MNNLFPKATPRQVQKNPVGYAMLVMAALLGAFVSWGISSNRDADKVIIETKDKIIEQQNKTIEALQSRNNYLTDIFIKKDSVNRAILDKPVQDLLRQVKK